MLATLYDEETKTHKDVAIQILDKKNPKNTYNSFKNEVTAGPALGKEKDTFTDTIAAFEYDETNSFQIVMELADITFSDAIDLFKDKDRKLPTDIIGYMIASDAQVINTIVSCNIWYHDLHKDNHLLFFNQNKIKTCDFGQCSIEKDVRQCYR